MGDLPDRVFSMRVGFDAATVAVGEPALADCLRALKLGWQYCSGAVDACSTVVIDGADTSFVMFDPDRCHQRVDLTTWILGSHRVPQVAVVPRRASADEDPVAIKTPPAPP